MAFRPSAEIRIILRAIDQASAQMKVVGTSARGLGGQISSLGKIAQIAGGMIVADLALRATDAIQRFVRDSVKEFGEFESVLAKVTASSGEVGLAALQLADDIRKAAWAAGREFGVGAIQATSAMEALVKAGMKGDQAITALNATLMMATIEEMNTAEAAKYVVQSLGMFGKSADDASEMVDILTNASIKGVDTVREYAIGLGYCGKTMSTYGLTAEEAAAALVALNNQGIQAEKAGRYLDAMFRDLIQNTDKFGFELYDATGSMISMDEIIRRLVTKLGEFGTEQERNAYLAEVFGTQSRRAVLALIDMTYEGEKGAEAYKLLADAMGESGSAARYFARLANTQEFAMKRMNAAMEEARIELGEALAPIIVEFAEVLEDHVVPAIKEFAEYTDNLVWLLEKLGEALDPVISAWKAYDKAVSDATDGTIQASDAFLYLLSPGAFLVKQTNDLVTAWRDNEAMMLLNKVAAGELTIAEEELYEAVSRAAEATGNEEKAIIDEMRVMREALGITGLTIEEMEALGESLDKTSFARMENFTAAQELIRAEEEVAVSTKMSKEALEELAKQLEDMDEIYLENVIKKNADFQASVDETAREILDLCETSEDVDSFSEDAQVAIDRLAKEWGIDFEDARKIVEAAMEDIRDAIEEVPKTVEEELLERAQDNLEKFKQCVGEKSTATKEEFKAAWDALVTDTNELIAAGLLGQAQDNIQVFADCVIDKEADMVQQVDDLIEKLTEEMNTEFERMMAYADQFTGAERDMWIQRAEELKEGYLAKIAALEDMKNIALTRMLLADQGFTTEEINTIMAGLIQLHSLSGDKWDDIVATWDAALKEAKGDIAAAIAAIQAEINRLQGKTVTITTIHETIYREGTQIRATTTGGMVVQPITPEYPTGYLGCFLAGTKILMADGSEKTIEKVKLGDRVLSWDLNKNKPIKAEVSATFQHKVKGFFILNDRIMVTGGHPFFTREGWVFAQHLEASDILFKGNKGFSEKITKKIFVDKAVEVYNLHVAILENYFADGVLVHNKIPLQMGIESVPYPGITAWLHPKEAVLRADEAERWRRGLGRGGGVSITIEKAILTSDQNIRATAQKLAHYEAIERRRQGLS